ncbi:hypothetical protein BDV06DRAFT_226110 [Aspergillus oleicola]
MELTYRTSVCFSRRLVQRFQARDWRRASTETLQQQEIPPIIKLEKLPNDLSSAQKASLSATQDGINRNAIEEESFKAKGKKRTCDLEYDISILLKSLFEKQIHKTATVKLQNSEDLEYQLWHQEVARDYGCQRITNENGRTILKHSSPKFFRAQRPLRRLCMAAFSTKMAHLNSVMESIKSNTYVRTLRVWRDIELDPKVICDITRGEGGKNVHGITADDLISYLVSGSPAARVVCQKLLTIRAIEKVDKRRYGHHQKLIVGEDLPANSCYLQQVLRICLIDARVFHVDLSYQARSQMVDLFNDPNSALKVLIKLFDVGAVGLNSHKACNRVVITSLPRSRAQESQLAGRASRFPLTVVRRFTLDDQFRAVKQAEKAALQSAANANEPCIKKLVVKLFNEFQNEVNKCHQDPGISSLRAAVQKGETLE